MRRLASAEKQFAKATERNTAEKKRPQSAKWQQRRGGEGTAITHWSLYSVLDALFRQRFVASNVRRTQTWSNNIQFLFVSKWSKLENKFSNSVSAVENVEGLCPDIKIWNDEITCVIFVREDFL